MADSRSFTDGELSHAEGRRWTSLTAAQAAEALAIVQQIRAARASAKTDLERLINRTRLMHGTAVGASMLHRYG